MCINRILSLKPEKTGGGYKVVRSRVVEGVREYTGLVYQNSGSRTFSGYTNRPETELEWYKQNQEQTSTGEGYLYRPFNNPYDPGGPIITGFHIFLSLPDAIGFVRINNWGEEAHYVKVSYREASILGVQDDLVGAKVMVANKFTITEYLGRHIFGQYREREELKYILCPKCKGLGIVEVLIPDKVPQSVGTNLKPCPDCKGFGIVNPRGAIQEQSKEEEQ